MAVGVNISTSFGFNHGVTSIEDDREDGCDLYHCHSVHVLNSSTTSPRHCLETHARLVLEDSTFVHHAGKGAPPLYINAHPGIHMLHDRLRISACHLRQRSLTDRLTINVDNEMTALATEAPSSPPGLTGSKSSKSSSCLSSSLSGADGILSDITHFEEIGLDEDRPRLAPPKQQTYGAEKPLRPAPRMSAPAISGPRGNAAAMTTMRELTNSGPRPILTKMRGSGKSHIPTHSLSLPSENMPYRSHRNASTPSLAIRAMSNRSRSRSPSPNPASPMARPVPTPTPRPSPRLSAMSINSSGHHPVRRGSWQPSRKTVKELEAEYNDEDDDLPDDASLWNVPLSPRPPSERSPIIGGVSPKSSPIVSPERPSPLRTSLSAPSAHAVRDTPAVPSGSAISPSWTSPPISPLNPKMARGASTGSMSEHFSYQPARVKSWNIVLSELSEEAKALTETLENHAVATAKKREDAVQQGIKFSHPKTETLLRSKTSIVELPPLRLNNVMIDPLPVSKEKEKVLTRTRPSWLPPKSQKEEKKHLKEYQQMMERSQEAERRRAATTVDRQCAKDDTKKALLRIWEEHVLPNWDQVIREPRTRELWWRGVAPKSRAEVWQRAVGNELALTEVTFKRALERAKDADKKMAENRNNELLGNERKWFDAIRRDVRDAFPEMKIFQAGGPLHDSLVDVLMAYSMYRSDVGYSHGTHLIAALMLLTLPNTHSAFMTLSNFLNRPLPLAFLTGDPAATDRAYKLTLSLLATKYPRLHSHLFVTKSQATTSSEEIATRLSVASGPPSATSVDGSTAATSSASLELDPALVLEPLYRTLFLAPNGGLGLDMAARVWDVILFDGDTAMIRTAVAILGSLEGKLYGDRASVLNLLGWAGTGWAESLGGEDEFMKRVREVGKDDRTPI